MTPNNVNEPNNVSNCRLAGYSRRASIWTTAFRSVCSIGVSLLVATALAQSEFPEGPGKATFFKVCSQCHRADLVLGMRQSKEGWKATVDDMVIRGAPGTDEDFQKIMEYLAKSFPDSPAKIRVNDAVAKDLESGLEISAKDAEAIVRYREKNGNIKDWDVLRKIPGLDAAKIEPKKDRLVF
jgi:competence protein ComEA